MAAANQRCANLAAVKATTVLGHVHQNCKIKWSIGLEGAQLARGDLGIHGPLPPSSLTFCCNSFGQTVTRSGSRVKCVSVLISYELLHDLIVGEMAQHLMRPGVLEGRCKESGTEWTHSQLRSSSAMIHPWKRAMSSLHGIC